VLDDPKTRFGFNDQRNAADDSRRLSVIIMAQYPDHGPHREKPKLVSEFWTEGSIRAATKLFVEGLIARGEDLRNALRQQGIDPNSPPAGAHYDYEDGLRGGVSEP
jgi:hypothetical protein